MLVSRVRQPCSLVVLPIFRVRRTQPHTSRCNVSFGLAVGEGVLDLRLPSASRIPNFYVMVQVPCYALSSDFYLWIICVYFLLLSVQLSPSCPPSVNRYPPPSPFSTFCPVVPVALLLPL